MFYPMKEIENLKQPIVCCGSCKTPVFILDEGAKLRDEVYQTLMKSRPIYPQPKPIQGEKRLCATCGVTWIGRCFLLLEGRDYFGPNTTNR